MLVCLSRVDPISSHLISSRSFFLSVSLFFGCLDFGGLFLSLGKSLTTAWAEAGMCSCVLGHFEEAFFPSFLLYGRIDSALVRDVLY
jgi:hypothetical protein